MILSPKDALNRIMRDVAVAEDGHRFIKAMNRAGALRDEEVVDLLEKPWKWVDEYREWYAADCPRDEDDRGWERFNRALEAQGYAADIP